MGIARECLYFNETNKKNDNPQNNIMDSQQFKNQEQEDEQMVEFPVEFKHCKI